MAEKLLCPIPKETILETVPCSRDVRIKIRDLQQELSRGYSFKSFGAIEGAETLALIRAAVDTCPYEPILWHSVENDELARTRTKEMRTIQGLMSRRMQAFITWPDRTSLTVEEIRCRVIVERAGSLYRQIDRLIAGQPLDSSDDLQLNLCRFLMLRTVGNVELDQLRDKIVTHQWEAIPLVFFAAALAALLDRGRIRGRKYTVNDEVDISRVSIALHCSVMMITEKSMAYSVRQLEKEWGESLEVFGINERDAIQTSLETALAE
jgi:hypothetical protein